MRKINIVSGQELKQMLLTEWGIYMYKYIAHGFTIEMQ